MNNWSTRTLPLFNGHQRSASVVGYQDYFYPPNEPPKYDQNWNNRSQGTFYSSSMDISKSGPESTDYKRFVWRSSQPNHPSKSVSTYHEPSEYSQRQRPFESAFKSAIIKMKESSLSRLGAVEKNIPTGNAVKNNCVSETENYYERNCQTLPISKKTNAGIQKADLSKKIFKCESFQNKNRSSEYSASKVSSHNISDTESDKTSRSSQQLPVNDLNEKSNKLSTSPSNIKYSSEDKTPRPGSSVIIPVKDKKVSLPPADQAVVITETYISPNFAKSSQSALPDNFHFNKDNVDDTLNFEPLPSVQEIISKVEALNEQAGKNIMTKSLNLTHEKPPVLLNYRSGSQRAIDTNQNSSSQNDYHLQNQKRMSGLYKKQNTSATSKGKSLSNLPSDFQKLHLAFLDQKQENQRLRQELAEKNEIIIKLEASLKSYEPWR